MGMSNTGVYPVYENQFKVGDDKENANTIADMESFSVSFDNNVEEWKPMDQAGWTRRLMTGKGVKITINGKRNIGDTGNDYVAGKVFKNGKDANGVLIWTFPDETEIIFNVVFNVTNVGSGDSTNVGPLEFEALSDGRPEVKES